MMSLLEYLSFRKWPFTVFKAPPENHYPLHLSSLFFELYGTSESSYDGSGRKVTTNDATSEHAWANIAKVHHDTVKPSFGQKHTWAGNGSRACSSVV
jgi:hypothetical protein